MVSLATSDCLGIEITGNGLYGGNGVVAAGKGKPLIVDASKTFPLGDAARPAPAVPSIYERRKEHK
ncbi:MAG: hypothetical protein JW837_15150 [Sedimentisphaerales bacterium]|nr:hypothetical protein [Sedimentisphaerales bacterium]